MGWGWFQVQVGDAHVAIPEGRLATAVTTGAGKGRDFGYVMFVDHDAKSIRPVEWELRRILAPSAWLPLPIACLAGVIGAVSDPVPKAPPLVGALLFAMVAWALTAGIMKWAQRRRVRRFIERDAQRIADAAGKSAVHPGRPPERDAEGNVIQPLPAAAASATEGQVEAAAQQVTDSLLPFVPTVGHDGQPLPPTVWATPFFVGFVIAYAAAGLKRVSRSPDLPRETVSDVARRVGYRIALSRGVDDPAAFVAHDEDDPGAKEQRQSGIKAAQFVLACFAGDAEALAHPAVQAAPALKLPPGMIQTEPPATRLHPDGPHAAMAQRVLAYMFSQQLLELGRNPD